MPPSSCMQLQKSCAVGLASLGVMRRAHKVDQLMHELEVLEFPTGVRALKDYDRGELTIGWPSASHLPGPTSKSSPIGEIQSTCSSTEHTSFSQTATRQFGHKHLIKVFAFSHCARSLPGKISRRSPTLPTRQKTHPFWIGGSTPSHPEL